MSLKRNQAIAIMDDIVEMGTQCWLHDTSCLLVMST